jgi:hypothetical protein
MRDNFIDGQEWLLKKHGTRDTIDEAVKPSLPLESPL